MISNTLILVAGAIFTLVLSSHADELDDLRVSSVTHFDGNYHTMTPAIRAKIGREDMSTNQIGKPLYMHTPVSQPQPPPPPSQSRQQQKGQQSRQEQSSNGKKQLKLAETTRSTQAPTSMSAADIDLGASSSAIANFNSLNTCRWIPLKDMRNVNFETGEIIIRDAADQPCYIMSIQAFIKYNEDAYFPLRGFKPYPNGAHKIDYYNHTQAEPESSAPYRMPLNCSLPDTSAFLLSHDRRPSDYYLFKEEITLQLNCGYLVFKLKLDYAYQLLLEAISFYQHGDFVAYLNSDQSRAPASSARATKMGKRPASSPRPPAKVKPAPMEMEHLVFAIQSADHDTTPLIAMPLYSRYVCQNRIVLTGNNSIQLVIDRFELSRLITVPNDRLRVNLRHRAHLHSITRCPEPAQPTSNLTVMMSWSDGTGSAAGNASAATSNKLVANKSSSFRPDGVSQRLWPLANAVIALVLIRWSSLPWRKWE